MDPLVVGALAAAAVGVPLALGVRRWLDARRAADMRAFGETLGLRFTPRDDALGRSGLTRLSLVRDGHDPSFLHVLRGSSEGGELLVFDYRVRIGTALTALTEDSLVADALIGVRKNRAPTYYNMTAVALRTEHDHYPSFAARNGRVVKGALDAGALDVLRRLRGHVHAEAGGEWLVVYRFDRRVPTSELADFVARARGLARTLTTSAAPSRTLAG